MRGLCREPGCRTEVELIRTWNIDEPPKRGEQPKFMPLDLDTYARDDVLANAAVSGIHAMNRRVRILKNGEEPLAEEERRMPHFATCKARKPPKPADPTAPPPQREGRSRRPAVTEDEPERSLEDWLGDLDKLVGLDVVKAEVRRQVKLIRNAERRAAAGLRNPAMTRHLVFTGNPGTGKTTVARIVAGAYRAMGLLSKGHLVETDESQLVAGYLGHTAIQTREIVQKALGGVLFIDEAYSLAVREDAGQADAFKRECINTLVPLMENHRDDLVVIAAGYPLPMREFIESNPGLESRFRTFIDFPDYSDAELVEVFARLAEAADYRASIDCLQTLLHDLAGTPRGEAFGNGRYARNLLEAAIANQAARLDDVDDPTIEQMQELTADDLLGARATQHDGAHR